MTQSDDLLIRCPWAKGDALYHHYHDVEWGVPKVQDAQLFECLTLEGAQAGLSWRTILNKREGYRRAFKGFDPAKVARMRDTTVDRLLLDPAIVRHRGKIESTLYNARQILKIQEEYGSFARFVWSFVDDKPIQNAWAAMGDVPAQTEAATALSKALKKRGFRFVGPTTCYAFMQAIGAVNDHVVRCFRFEDVKATPFEAPWD